jgi:phosphate transport system permease protein
MAGPLLRPGRSDGAKGNGSGPISATRASLQGSNRGRLADPLFRALVTTAGISVLVVLAAMITRTTADSWIIFRYEGFGGFFFGDEWSSGDSRGTDLAQFDGTYGAWPFVYGTFITSLIAIVIALPLAICVAVYVNHMAPDRLKKPLTYGVETLAAVPSIVYGLWGLLFFAPVVIRPVMEALNRWLGDHIFLFSGTVYSTSYFTLGVVLAIMILPIITAIVREVLAAVPMDDQQAAYGLGATRREVILHVVLPRSFSGIVGGTMLGLGRAVGETMAAAMLVGASQRQDWSLFFGGDTMAAHIANTFQDATPETVLGLMAIGVALFLFTTTINVAARALVWRVGRSTGDAAV